MAGVPIKCQNTDCTNSNTIATYRHAHGVLTKTWTAPAVGPTPDSVPYPQPCPNDGTPCPAVSIECGNCKWTKQYPNS